MSRVTGLGRLFRLKPLAVAGTTALAANYALGDEDRTFLGSLFGQRTLYSYTKPTDDIANHRPSPTWTPPKRKDLIKSLKSSADAEGEEFDLLIIGGGATGAGTAVDAASRGLKVALVEREDFASGTSSKSTKLVHGGVRYLQKAIFELDYEQYKLVAEALYERKTFLEIAPYLTSSLPIILPVYTYWQIPYFFAGTKMYDWIAGSQALEGSYVMGKTRTLEAFPTLNPHNLTGSVVYYDGQQNDSRMNVVLILSAINLGCTATNYTNVENLIKSSEGKITGAQVKDLETGDSFPVKAKGVINATGPFTDKILQMDEPHTSDIVSPAGGVHIALPEYFAPKNLGLLDPATSDGRVVFFLPWEHCVIAGTTDALTEIKQDPIPTEEEISFILKEVQHYLSPDVQVRRGDVLSAWSGIRPLVRDPKAKNTQSLVRNHMIHVSKSGLLTIAGGKWTTYRAMAQETVDEAVKLFGLKHAGPCITDKVKLFGAHGWTPNLFIKLVQYFGLETDIAQHLASTYGDRAWSVAAMGTPTGRRWPVVGHRLDPQYPYIDAEIRYACRREYAVHVTDVIGRRTRLAFINSKAALDALPAIIDIMTKELGWDTKRQIVEFDRAKKYLLSMGLYESEVLPLSLEDVRARKHLIPEAPAAKLLARNTFSADEISALVERFHSLDANQDGMIDPSDLVASLSKLHVDFDANKIADIVDEVDNDQDGQIDLSEFFDIAVAAKQASLSSAFSSLVQRMETPRKEIATQLEGPLPVEKSGGGV